MYIRTLRKELHKLKKEENKWKEVKVIQLKIEGERKKKSIKKIGKARKSFLESRVQRVRGWRANFRQKYWLCPWKNVSRAREKNQSPISLLILVIGPDLPPVLLPFL